ncbi:MAG: hypothetical protein ABI384_01685 [Allobranchiibius sp.]
MTLHDAQGSTGDSHDGDESADQHGQDRTSTKQEQERIRALLAGVDDPGPMPTSVADRIQAVLADEQRRRAPGHVDELAAHRARRRKSRNPLRVMAIAASAAVVLLGAGAVGYAALDTPQAPVAQAPVQVGNLANRISVAQTGQDYTRAGLPTQAVTLLNSPLRTNVPPRVVQQYGAMATSEGILGCLGSLGSALAGNPDRIVVDFARYNGSPAVAVVLTKGTTNTAWVVSRSCSSTSTPLAGPASVIT